MSKTVAVISDAGRLTDALGRNKESDARLAKFSKRILGESGTVAVLNYGWNGKSALKITGDGDTRGTLITLNAETVLVPSTLKIGNETLQEVIDACTDLAIQGIVGTSQQLDVTKSDNPSSDPSAPRIICRISLNQDVLDRISSIEATLKDLFRFSEVYKVGDGLIVDRGVDNRLSVNIGDGLMFEDDPSDENVKKVSVMMDNVPVEGSANLITSGGVYAALHTGPWARYTIGLDEETGNMTLYAHN